MYISLAHIHSQFLKATDICPHKMSSYRMTFQVSNKYAFYTQTKEMVFLYTGSCPILWMNLIHCIELFKWHRWFKQVDCISSTTHNSPI